MAGQGTTAFVNAPEAPLKGGALQLDTKAYDADKAALYTTLHAGVPASSIMELGCFTKAMAHLTARASFRRLRGSRCQ